MKKHKLSPSYGRDFHLSAATRKGLIAFRQASHPCLKSVKISAVSMLLLLFFSLITVFAVSDKTEAIALNTLSTDTVSNSGGVPYWIFGNFSGTDYSLSSLGFPLVGASVAPGSNFFTGIYDDVYYYIGRSGYSTTVQCNANLISIAVSYENLIDLPEDTKQGGSWLMLSMDNTTTLPILSQAYSGLPFGFGNITSRMGDDSVLPSLGDGLVEAEFDASGYTVNDLSNLIVGIIQFSGNERLTTVTSTPPKLDITYDDSSCTANTPPTTEQALPADPLQPTAEVPRPISTKAQLANTGQNVELIYLLSLSLTLIGLKIRKMLIPAK